jgi:chromosome partitioning protein
MKIVACYSNKGGVGKTALSVNLAHTWSAQGKRVLLCDLDPQGASSYYFRVKPSEKLRDKDFFEDVKRFTDAIRASDYENLDVLPANAGFRDFDIFLSRLRNSRSRLKKALQAVDSEYDLAILDCPPNISLLSENIFRSADLIVVPVIPTTLSERTLAQLHEFFKEHEFDTKRIVPVFSMVEKRKTMHTDTIARLRRKYKRTLTPEIPFSSDVEKMGLHRAPVATYAGNRPAALAYIEVWRELSDHKLLR